MDYLVATDAIGMGLNLDVNHVAFAGLSKFDGQRQRRLTTAEMAQIAGRAGRHQRDGTFGTLAGTRSHNAEFSEEEIYAIEEHRFPPLTRLFWRDAEPRFDSLSTLIADLEAPPDRLELMPAPEAIDLAVLKRLADDPGVAETVRGRASVARFWDACRLPDFRQQGSETHARFVARLWEDLRCGHLASDYVAARIAELDNPSGDIDTLQGRIAGIRSWAYIAQRPDWILAKDEMASRARTVEARLSDALHGRLTERFVNRRTTVLMKKLGPDAALLPVTLEGDELLVDGEPIGSLVGFRFRVDPLATADDHKLLLAAAEKHLPSLLAGRADALVRQLRDDPDLLTLHDGAVLWNGATVARLAAGRSLFHPRLKPDAGLDRIPDASRRMLVDALTAWLDRRLEVLTPLRKLDAASRSPEAGPELRALLIRLVEAGGLLGRGASGLDELDISKRDQLRRLGVRIGALDIFLPTMLRPAPLAQWRQLAKIAGREPVDAILDGMPPVVTAPRAPLGYRSLGGAASHGQSLRIDMAEKLLREAHDIRTAVGRKPFVLNPARAVSMGLSTASYAWLLRLGGFRPLMPRSLSDEHFGPPQPLRWRWRPERRSMPMASPPLREGGAFAALAELVR